VARLKDGMILIHDLARFLSLEEKAVLEQPWGCGTGMNMGTDTSTSLLPVSANS